MILFRVRRHDLEAIMSKRLLAMSITAVPPDHGGENFAAHIHVTFEYSHGEAFCVPYNGKSIRW